MSFWLCSRTRTKMVPFFLLLMMVWAVGSQQQRLAIEAARRVDLLGRQGRHSEAVEAFDGGKGLPASLATIAWYNHGLSLTELGRLGEAAAAFAACLEIGGGQREYEVLLKLGDTLAKSEDWTRAAEAYARASNLDESSSDGGLALANAGAALLNVGGRAREALSYLERAAAGGRYEWPHLALARADVGDRDGALEAIQHVDENSSEFLARLLDRHVDLSAYVLERIAEKTSSTYYRLSRLYSRSGDTARAADVRKRAVDDGIWKNEWQQPAYFAPFESSRAPPTPWIDFDSSCSPLEALVKEIETKVYPVAAAEEWTTTSFDEENVALERTSWAQSVLASNGRWIDHDDLSLLVNSTLGRWYDRLPKGSVMMSVLKPGAELVQHCGPSDHRIRIHLVLRGSENATLTVGNPADPHSTRSHFPNGKILVFDDSFLHSAANHGAADRVVLLVDVWHPALSGERARDKVRHDFQYDDKGLKR